MSHANTTLAAPRRGIRRIRRGCRALLLTAAVTATGAQAASPHLTMNDLAVRVLCIDAAGDGIGSGSGLVVGAGDHVATNWHVVECSAAGGSVLVLLDAARRATAAAEVRLHDAERDLALLRLAAPLDRPAPRFATLSTLERLDRVIAVGFPDAADGLANPAALSEATFTEGVVSRILPALPPLVQISAAINPGNSGGPLFDRAGRVIGLNTAKALVAVPTADGSGEGIAWQRVASGEGIGWAVASDALLPLLDRAGIPYLVSRNRLPDWLPAWASNLGSAAILALLLAIALPGAWALRARRARSDRPRTDDASGPAMPDDRARARAANRQVGRGPAGYPSDADGVGGTGGAGRGAAGHASGADGAGRGAAGHPSGAAAVARNPPGRRPVLRGIRGPYAGAEIPLDRGPVAIGRDPALTQLVLPPGATAISQRHALVRHERASGHFFVEDCWSTNGIYLIDPAPERPSTPRHRPPAGADRSGDPFEDDAGAVRLPPGQAHRLEPGMGFYLATPEIAFAVGFA